MEETKNKFGLGIMMGILITLVIGLSVFIIYDKFLSNTDNNNNNTEVNENINDKESNENDKIINLSESESKELFEKIKVYNDYFIDYYSQQGIKTATNNQILYFLAVEQFKTGSRESFTINSLKPIANNYLADNIKVTYEDIRFPGYEEATLFTLEGETYKASSPGMGGPGSYMMGEYYIDATYNETKDMYVVNTKLLFNQWCPDVCGPHNSYYSDAKSNNVVYTNNSDNYMEIDSVYPLVKDKLPITSYSFTKNSSGNYVLSSVVTK